jgi:4-carboxymuconolactone decarboxylase
MSDDVAKKTAETAKLYFEGVTGERPYELWRAFDKDLAKELSLFITGRMYARGKLPHTTRQLVTVAALTVLERSEELRLHIHAALNVGVPPRDVAEAIFQTGIYGGIPAMNQGLKALRTVLEDRGQWPLPEE